VLQTASGLQTTEVGEVLGIDQTTATRTLALMKKSKLVLDTKGTDRRERRWRLTPLGEATFRRIQPKWERAQAMVERRLGRTEAIALKKDAFRAACEFAAANENYANQEAEPDAAHAMGRLVDFGAYINWMPLEKGHLDLYLADLIRCDFE
jgi:DNA-binding MarR family transcriptional regulator